ncbi:hypothetical protein MKEN_00981600 [Mycena kentingensis (nom. inval.)]|nr:hypothetical protein MKEN_00981600 [Mycena kentingensis (nom. inval.)]
MLVFEPEPSLCSTLLPLPPSPPMRMHTPRSLSLPLLLPLLLLGLTHTPLLARAQANRTIDDWAPEISYDPDTAASIVRQNLTGFQVSKLYNGTVTIMNATELSSVNMTMRFTGTELYVFLAKPQNDGQYGISYNVYLDGANVNQVGSFSQVEDAEYGDVAYENNNLTMGAHTLILEATGGEVYLDYVVFRSNSAVPETTIPPLPDPTSSVVPSSASGSVSKSKATTTSSSPSTSASSAAKKRSSIGLIAGAAVAVLAVLAIVAAIMFLRKRRRANAGVSPVHGQPGTGPYGSGGGYPQQNASPHMQQQNTSQAGLLHQPSVYASASASQYSLPTHDHPQQGYGHPPPPMPQQYHNNAQVPQYAYSHSPEDQPQPHPYAPMQNPHDYGYASSEHVHGHASPPPSMASNPYLHPQQQQNNAYPPSPTGPGYAPTVLSSSASGHSHASSSSSRPLLVRNESQSQGQLQYDYSYNPKASATLAYAPSGRRATEGMEGMEAVLAEQRAVEAEYVRPGPDVAGSGDDKKMLAERERMSVANPDAGPSARTQPHTPPSPSQQGENMTSITQQMAALRAQVARLEGERMEMAGVPPPAYD